MPSGFDPDEVEDVYSKMLQDAIQAAAKNKTVKAGAKKVVAAPPDDLLAALKASIDANKPRKTKARIKTSA